MEAKGVYIQAVPLDNQLNKIFLKDLEIIEDRYFVKYCTTINDIPWQRVEMLESSSDNTFTIHGGNGVVLYRIALFFIQKLYYQGTIVIDAEGGENEQGN